MLRSKPICVFACLALLFGMPLASCTTPVIDDQGGNGDGDGGGGGGGASGGDGGTMPDAATRALVGKQLTGRIVMGVIVARNEDRRAASETLRLRGPGSTPCPFGGSRSTDEDGVTTFDDCGILPGVVLRGGIRFTPGAEGTQGGRIEFMDLEGENNGNPFSLDGTIEETENPDGSLSFEADVRSSQTGDGETDEFNFNGEVKVNEDGSMEGNLHLDSGEGENSSNECDLNGVNIFDFQNDASVLNGPCGFEELDDFDDFDSDQQMPDDEMPNDDMPDDEGDEDDGSLCDCAPGEECIEFEGDDGTPQAFCSNCDTNEDCVRKGLGNECSLGLTCTTVECFTSDDCPEGFECDGFLGGGECVEKSFFPLPL